MFKKSKVVQSRQERLDALLSPNSLILDKILPYAVALMGSIGFGIFAMFVLLAATGKL